MNLNFYNLLNEYKFLIPDERLAILSHYLHNENRDIKRYYEKEAKRVIKNISNLYKTKSNDITNLIEQFEYHSKSVPFLPNNNYRFTFIDLFAGIGGFRMAMQNIGGKCVFSSEWDLQAQKTYLLNYGEVPFGDITKESVKSLIPDGFDILCAGFPCQAFSISGKKKGFEDTRGTLFFDVCSIIKKKKPKVVVLENVKHLVNHDNKKTFQIILSSLEELGYNVSYSILNSSDFGVPQSRERIIIVGTLVEKFDFSALQKAKPMKIRDILEKKGNFEYLDKSEYTLIDPKYIHQQKSGLIFVGYRNKGIWKKGIRPNTEHLSRCHRQPNRIYSVDGVHPTIPSQETSGRFWIYIPEEDIVRKLTITECYKLMGFPNNFIINTNKCNAYNQCGNSVVIPMVYEIAKTIVNQYFIK